jgi:hypothetical protein
MCTVFYGILAVMIVVTIIILIFDIVVGDD